MSLGSFRVPAPVNEPVRSYAPGSPEKTALKRRLAALAAEPVEVPIVAGGREIRTGKTEAIVAPHDRRRRLGTFHQAGTAEVALAIDAAEKARPAWAATPFEDRAAVFLRAAEMLATTHRDLLNASTMLGQSKTAHQAEIDSACELIDFWRYNPWFAQRIQEEQPLSAPGAWNRMEHRPLDGFVFAVTPFNFTSIAGNLPTAPVLFGNTVVWKPASTSILSNWHILKLLEQAGLPPGVVNFVPGQGAAVGDPVLADPRL